MTRALSEIEIKGVAATRAGGSCRGAVWARPDRRHLARERPCRRTGAGRESLKDGRARSDAPSLSHPHSSVSLSLNNTQLSPCVLGLLLVHRTRSSLVPEVTSSLTLHPVPPLPRFACSPIRFLLRPSRPLSSFSTQQCLPFRRSSGMLRATLTSPSASPSSSVRLRLGLPATLLRACSVESHLSLIHI